MLLPRPEIRMATRLGSRIMCRGPFSGRVPRSGTPPNGAAPLPRLDTPDFEDGLARTFECIGDGRNLTGADDHRHSNAAVEGARHLFRRDSAALLEEREYARQLPPAGIYHSVAIFG